MKVPARFLIRVATTIAAFVLVFHGTRHFSIQDSPRVRILTNENAISTAENSSVMISAYMRSGSTFISNLLTFRNDTFLWYEPLWKMQPWGYYDNEKRVCSLTRPSCQPSCFLLSQCFSKSPLPISSRSAPNSFNPDTDEAYTKCRMDGFSTPECYPVFTRRCESSRHIVTKSLRLSVQLTEPLLKNFPNLKVLKILRDPRAIIYSRIHAKWYPISDEPGRFKPVEDTAKVLCGRIKRDIEGTELLMRKFPNRFKIIQYEDTVGITEKPTAIYKFLDMDPSATDSRMVKLLEKNKKYIPDTYRTKMSKDILEIVQKHCAGVIEMLGLRVFSSYEEMANNSVSVIRKRLPYAV